jgi:hypothetical protein
MNIYALNTRQQELVSYIFLGIVLTYFIGMRDVSLGADTFTYYRYFNYVKYNSLFVGAGGCPEFCVNVG